MSPGDEHDYRGKEQGAARTTRTAPSAAPVRPAPVSPTATRATLTRAAPSATPARS